MASAVDTAQAASGQPCPSCVVPSITFTIKGRLFYNDLREAGRFSSRSDRYGHAGTSVAYSDTATNYLAALDMVADIYEIDAVSGGSCVAQELIGSATVGSTGDFSGTFTAKDACGPSALEIGVRFRTRFCNSTRCFSTVKDDGSTVYQLWASNVSASHPLTVTGGTVDLGDRYFQSVSDGHDVYSQASNIYASLVDVSRVVYVNEGIPFEKATYGELHVDFPSTDSDVASTASASVIHIPAADPWPKGDGPMHEFGHVVMMRAWDGTTGDCGDCPGGQYARDGDDTWSIGSLEYPNAAFGEGWANFIRRASDDSCAEIDVNSADHPIYSASETYPISHPDDGKSFAGNVTKLLCDWYDAAGDDDPYMAGDGDHFVASSLYSVWQNLDAMWDWVDSVEGLSVCDYVDYYVNGRKSAELVGEDEHERYEALIADLAFNNGLECDLPTP
jgi:hypothetical protein